MQIAIYISINNNHLSSFAQIYLIIDIDALHTVVCWTHNGTIKTFISVEKVNICLCIRILKLLSSDIFPFYLCSLNPQLNFVENLSLKMIKAEMEKHGYFTHD